MLTFLPFNGLISQSPSEALAPYYMYKAMKGLEWTLLLLYYAT